MSFENAFGIVAVVVEVAVVALLVYRRVWRRLPVFFVYCIWALFSDGLAYSIRIFNPGGYSLNFYIAETVLDFVLQFSVLVELAWSVLLPLRKNLSRKALWVVAALILVVGAAIWPFAFKSLAFHPATTADSIDSQGLPFRRAGWMQPVAFARLARSRVTGCYGIRILFPGKSCRGGREYPSIYGAAIRPPVPRSRLQLFGILALLDIQLCAKRSAAPGIHPPDAKHPFDAGWHRSTFPHHPDRSYGCRNPKLRKMIEPQFQYGMALTLPWPAAWV